MPDGRTEAPAGPAARGPALCGGGNCTGDLASGGCSGSCRLDDGPSRTVEKKRKLYPVFMVALPAVYLLPELAIEGHLPPVWVVLAIAGFSVANIRGGLLVKRCRCVRPAARSQGTRTVRTVRRPSSSGSPVAPKGQRCGRRPESRRRAGTTMERRYRTRHGPSGELRPGRCAAVDPPGCGAPPQSDHVHWLPGPRKA